MKDETKSKFLNFIYPVLYLVAITVVCLMIRYRISALDEKIASIDTKLESIFYFTRDVRFTLFEDTCHKQGGIYSETKDGGRRCDKIEAYKSHLQGYDNFSEKDSYFLSEETCSVYKNTSNSVNLSVYSGSKEALEKNVVPLCLKWKEARDVLRKKNYKEYACKTLDTFEDYLACNEK